MRTFRVPKRGMRSSFAKDLLSFATLPISATVSLSRTNTQNEYKNV